MSYTGGGLEIGGVPCRYRLVRYRKFVGAFGLQNNEVKYGNSRTNYDEGSESSNCGNGSLGPAEW